jgi:hypothetical protein
MNYLTLTTGLILSVFTFAFGQTTILEQDGDQNEFIPSDWTVQGGGFANTDQVNIMSGGSGRLDFSNSDSYTDITVEIHFSQQNTINYDLRIFSGTTEEAAELGNISDNTGADNVSIVNFNNTSPIAIDAIDLSNANLTVGVTYVRITGTLDGTSNVNTEQISSFQLSFEDNKTIIVDSEVKGEVEVYNINGQFVNTNKIEKGATEINYNNLRGIHLMIFRDAFGNILERRKLNFN